MKNKLSIIATVVISFALTACGGGAAVADESSPITTKNAIGTQSIESVRHSELYLSNPENDDLLQDILALGDVNGDGYDDILIGVMRLEKGTWNSVKREVKPILLMYDPAKQTYIVSEEFKNITSKHIWPRQAAIADFDGDGRNDIFIADHGVDGGKYDCGNNNSLVLNKSTGMLNASNLLPAVDDYSHGLAVADFNKDKLPDLLVLNSPWIRPSFCTEPGVSYRNRSYVLSGPNLSEIKLNFNVDDAVNLGFTELAYKDPMLLSAASDLNKDGFADIVFAGNYGLRIAESSGLMTYGKIQKIPPPAKYFTLFDKNNCLVLSEFSDDCMTPYSFITFYDIDGDGQQEIIASLLNQSKNGHWNGQYFQALKKVNGYWTDITDSVFPEQNNNQSAGGEWCYRIQFADFNGDGKLDMLCSFYTSTVWLFNNGQFKKSQTVRNKTAIVNLAGTNFIINFVIQDNSIQLSGDKL